MEPIIDRAPDCSAISEAPSSLTLLMGVAHAAMTPGARIAPGSSRSSARALGDRARLRRLLGGLMGSLVALVALCALGLTAGADGARAAAPITGFLSAPTDQVAVPGMLAGAEITPEGDLYTGSAEYELRFGTRLDAWNQPTRTLPNASLPLLSSTLFDGAVQYTQTVFAVPVAGQPVAYDTVTVTNGSDRPREARVAMAVAYSRGPEVLGAHGTITGAYRYERPMAPQRDGFYDQPGALFSPAFGYTTAGRDILRSGVLLARGPAAPSTPLSTPAATTLTTPHDARLFVSDLRAGGRVSFTWQVPLETLAAGAGNDRALDRVGLSAAAAELRSNWGAEEAHMMKISVPEPKVSATYDAAITEILSSRYQSSSGWVQGSNKLQYQAFWIRDGALRPRHWTSRACTARPRRTSRFSTPSRNRTGCS